MSTWEFSSIIWFSLITIAMVFLGMFITKFIRYYPIVKAEMEAAADKSQHMLLKNFPPSMSQNGTVKFTHQSLEELGTHDGKTIYKFYVDDHGIYWEFDGVADPRNYSQRKDDPIVRIFIGGCLYVPISGTLT